MIVPGPHNRFTPPGSPVPAEEADALEAWLESITTPRHVERSRDSSGRSRRSPNGHGNGETSLLSAAEHFHAQLANAEKKSGLDVPVDAIWEQIMASATAQPIATGTAAELVSARHPRHVERSRDQRSASLRRGGDARQRTIPTWLAGSHWAVSVLMLAAVVVGIIALYGSFAGSPGSPGSDPATNPGFAIGTPGETTTPDDDIDRWLIDPSTVNCKRDPSGSVDSSEWATDRPSAVENYLPFAPAPAAIGQALADRWWYLNADCAPTTDDPLITDDFGWMPTSPIGIPTADQIAIAQEISAALPMQDYRSYYVNWEPASTATPDNGAGPGNRLVLLPQDVIQLADGRLGGPLRLPIHTDDPDNAISGFTGGLEAAATIFVVFEEVDGVWLLDEQFHVCVGECEAVWADLATFENYPSPIVPATPAATPAESTPSARSDWLALISPDECDVEPRPLEEVAALMQDPGETVPRQYGPVQPVSKAQGLEIASANRTFQACRLTGASGTWRAMMSPRLIYEAQGEVSPNPYAGQAYEDYVARNRELSALLLPEDEAPYTITSEQEAPLLEDGAYYDESVFGPVIVPDHVVQLGDGRLGGPQSRLLPANYDAIVESYWQGSPTPTPPGFTTVRYVIFSQDPAQENRWVLDETLDLCVDGCDAFYALVGQHYDEWSRTGPTPQDSGTPLATSESATPSADAASLQPISPGECDVEPRSLEEVAAIMRNRGDMVPRQYVPVTDVEPSVAQEVARAQRAWEACSARGLPGERRALESPRYIAEVAPYSVLAPDNLETFDDWVALNETMRAAFLDPNVE